MKNFLRLITLACAYLLFNSFAFTPRPASANGMEMEDVLGALKTGNAAKLSRYFDIRVDISLPEKTDNYSRTQAEMIIRDFFSVNNVSNFETKFKGDNNGSKYCIGLLRTRHGDFRTKLFMKQRDNKQLLQEIAFQLVE